MEEGSYPRSQMEQMGLDAFEDAMEAYIKTRFPRILSQDHFSGACCIYFKGDLKLLQAIQQLIFVHNRLKELIDETE